MEKVFIIQDSESGIPSLVCQDQPYANLVADEYEAQNGRPYKVIAVPFVTTKPSEPRRSIFSPYMRMWRK